MTSKVERETYFLKMSMMHIFKNYNFNNVKARNKKQ